MAKANQSTRSLKGSPQKKSRRRTPNKPSSSSSKNRATKSNQSATPKSSSQNSDNSFPVVGVGASAGGLEAFTRLLQRLPTDTGMGFVLVQHLDPIHKSALTSLLAKATSMPVREVVNNTRVEPNHVYVIPPNASLTIEAGVLRLVPRKKTDGQHRPIDHFYQSLAEDQGARAISVILSGTASDGTLGCEAIKAEGGITFAQDKSAKYDSMPRSAIAAGCVDFVLSPEDIAKELVRIARHPYVSSDLADEPVSLADVEESAREITEHPDRKIPGIKKDPFRQIMVLLRSATGVDFSLYKPNTIRRRIGRRMVLSKLKTLEAYVRHLKSDAREVEALYQDMLISVTGFFRNPEAFEVLKKSVFPKLFKNRSPVDTIRVWVLGCSTGQEAYSIAMSFLEFAAKADKNIPLQVFATDLNENLLEKARAGLYTKTLVSDLWPERRRRFFMEEDGGYRIIKPIREMCVFARQNVLTDPPFSRMDLISCRNLLIYLEPGSHKQILPTFHYALKPNGFLFLGASETVGPNTDLFSPVDKKHRIYAKKAAATRPLSLQLPAKYPVREKEALPRLPITPREGSELEAQREADRVTLNAFAPAGVLVNADFEILQFRGSTSRYLEPAPGRASFNLLKMAREGLLLPLRSALNKAKKENNRVRKENVRIEQNGNTATTNLEVIPLKNLKERCYLILFQAADPLRSAPSLEDARQNRKLKRTRGSRQLAEDRARENIDLKRELAEMRDYLQSVLEEHEAGNEELQASNEEVQSANEELQSINEELETSKEELESTNEELITVNEEMQKRNQEVNRVNDELKNLQSSVNLSIVVLDRDLTIRRFTAPAEKELNLLATDVGQPISRIKTNLDFPGLEQMIAEVIRTAAVNEKEVESKDGHTYSLRVRPYLTLDNKIDGAVMVLVDITRLKQIEERVRQERNYAQAIVRTVRTPLVVLNADLRVETASQSFYRDFEVTQKETEGRLIYELGNRQWDISALRQLLEDILPKQTFVVDYEVTHDFENIGTRTMLLSANRLESREDTPELILLNILDVTERERHKIAVQQSEERFRTAMTSVAEGLYTVDTNGLVTYINPAAERMFGWTSAELLGKKMHDATHHHHEDGSPFPASECAGLQVLQQGIELSEHEDIFIRKDGSFFPVVYSASPLKSGDATIGLVVAFRDDTERKRAEMELRDAVDSESHARVDAEAANRVKDEFLAIISHELRTPLNAITGWAQLLARGELDEENSLRAVRSIVRNAAGQAKIISDLLDTSRIVSGKFQLDRQPLNLQIVMNSVIEMLRPQAEAKGLNLIVERGERPAMVNGDATRLEQAIGNVLSNAIKFTSQGGRVEIRLREVKPDFMISVKDTGDGITQEFLPHIFERFQQADTTEKRTKGGLGLGLSIAKQLVEAHGGSIQAASDGKGKGAIFTIKLPVLKGEKQKPRGAVAPQQPIEETPAEDLPPDILKGLKVLVIDDQRDTRDLVNLALTAYGAKVRVCAAPNEAVGVVSRWKPSVIVSDIGMPETDGYELMKQIRRLKREKGGHTPAIALTGYASAVDELKAFEAGFNEHLAKPVSLAELARLVAKLGGTKRPT